MTASQVTQADFVEWIGSFATRPLEAVLAWYPWGQGVLKHQDGPDRWQAGALAALGEELRTGKRVVRVATRSGHGVGKTAFIAWLIHWFCSTHPHPQVIVTANTKTQLETKTWRELAKWRQLAINGDWFEWSATRYKLRDAPETWYASAIPWSRHNSQAFAGTHEQSVMVVFDEASEIVPEIWEVVEGALTGNTQLAIMVACGNPTQMVGSFADIWGKRRHRWVKFSVNAEESKLANQEQIQEWREDYGEDSDFYRVRVKGLPPHQGARSVVSLAHVAQARERHIPDHEVNPASPLLMGVDVARQGSDSNAMILRKGLKVLEPIYEWEDRDLMRMAGKVAQAINEHNPDLVFVDGIGFGAGVVDRLTQLGYDNVVMVQAGEKADDPSVYWNKRIEMWHRMGIWMKHADLPHKDRRMDKLQEELIAPEFHYDSKDLLRLESKDDMERRGIPSPNLADALAHTFAYKVPVKTMDDERLTEPEHVV